MCTCEHLKLVGGRRWHFGAGPCTEGEGRLAAVVGFHQDGTDSNQRGAAGAHRKRAWCASSGERERAVAWCVSSRANACCSLEAAVGFHQNKTDFIRRGAARSHRKRACRASSRERERAMARSHVRTRECLLLVGGRGWHVGARPCTEGEGRLAAVVGFYRARTESNQLGAARKHRKRAWCASFQESRCGGALACAHTRAPAARWRPRLARRSRAVHRGRGVCRGAFLKSI